VVEVDVREEEVDVGEVSDLWVDLCVDVDTMMYDMMYDVI
jgi:hypothetical protein